MSLLARLSRDHDAITPPITNLRGKVNCRTLSLQSDVHISRSGQFVWDVEDDAYVTTHAVRGTCSIVGYSKISL